MFPNPAKSEFTIESKNVKNFNVKVYDVLGKTIFNDFTNRGKVDVKRTSNFKSGMYLVQVTTGSSSYRTKLIIE